MKAKFSIDRIQNQILVEKVFHAPIANVWSAWTTAHILDQWWAPAPYIARTKSLEFREGGRWEYVMEGPKGDKHGSFAAYEKIVEASFIQWQDGFLNEQGNLNHQLPQSNWSILFSSKEDDTLVNVLIQFKNLTDLEANLQMGFEEGFSMGLENLDRYLSQTNQINSKSQKSPSKRITFYLNFPGNAEEALLFYKDAFDGKIIGELRRFRDIPTPPDHAPMSEDLKQLIMHGELELWDGVSIMATDATSEMGYSVSFGNNMHINIDASSKEEALHLFNKLSQGGKVEQPIEEMIWGAYYGSFTDAYGVNWMINYQEK